MYGGSTTSILVNVPGEASSVITAIEGHQLALQGKAGTALGLSAIGSFFAGIIGTIGLAFTASTLAEFSLKFGPAEMFSLVLMGMFTIIFVSGKDVTKSLMSMVIGLGLGTVGTDIVEGKDRFVYGISELLDGIDFVILVMGTFGIAEVLESAEEFMKITPMKVKFRDLFPKMSEIWYCRWAILRGTLVGFGICCIPGSGPTIASFLAYGVEKSVSKHPEKIRHRRPRRGRGSRVLQQRRGLRGDGPDVLPGHPRIGGHGGPPGRDDPLRPEARPDDLRRERRFRLGGHGLDVHRERAS